MKVVFSLGSAARCLLDEVEFTLQFAEGRASQGGPPYPCVLVGYGLAVATAMGSVLGEMRRLAAIPRIHMYDLESPEPQVAIFLTCANPSPKAIMDAAGPGHDPVIRSVGAWSSLGTFHVIGMLSAECQRIIDLYRQAGYLMLCVVDESDPEGIQNPLAVFRVETLSRDRPDFLAELT